MTVLERVRSRINVARKALSAAGDSLEDIRRTIAQLEGEREAIRSAPAPMSEAVEAIEELVDRLAAHAQYASVPVILDAAERGQVPHVDLHSRQIGATFGLFADILRPVLKGTLVAALEEHYAEIQAGLPRQARAERLAELDREILELSTQEEALIGELAASGLSVDRRGSADPRAVLGLDA